MPKLILILLLLISSFKSYSQLHDADTWYFGDYCGLSFSTTDNVPVALTNSAMKTDEGCAVISDWLGNLLFYTDGTTVWNRLHVQMPNGDNLDGNFSSTQSAIIVQKPRSEQFYYVFTVDCQGKSNGMKYSLVDMDKDQKLGDIILKNTPLHYPVSEKISAVKHKNERDVWVVTHEWNSNKFLSFLVTDTGVVDIPIITPIGSYHDGSDMNASGYMKFSSNGKKLALAIYDKGIVEIFNFDNKTGILSNPITIQSDLYKTAYGIEFSPDVSKLYFSCAGFDNPSAIFQINLNAGSNQDIINSVQNIIQGASYLLYHAMQIAPDRKIYIAKRGRNYLACINEPNKSFDKCRFVDDAVSLGDKKSRQGLPSFNQSFIDFSIEIKGNTLLCEGDTLYLNSNRLDSATYSWTGPNGLKSDSAFLDIPSVSLIDSGIYKLTVKMANITKSDSIFVKIFPKPVFRIIPGDTAYLCKGASLFLQSSSSFSNNKYLWNTGAKTQGIIVDSAGLYYLIIENENGCKDSAYCYVQQKLQPTPQIAQGDSIWLCNGGSELLSVKDSYASYQWSNGEFTPEIIANMDGYYFVTVTDNFGCKGVDSIKVNIVKMLASMPPNHNFGDLLIDLVENQQIDLISQSTVQMEIESIVLKDGNNAFKIKSKPDDLSVLLPNGNIPIVIEANPPSSGKFYDTLVVNFSSPCKAKYICVLECSGKSNKLELIIPHAKAKIGDKNYQIPIYARLLDTGSYKLSFNVEFAFSNQAFLVSPNQSQIVNQRLENGNRIITLRIDSVMVKNIQSVIGSIYGTVLLDNSPTPVNFISAECTNRHIKLDTTNGSLNLYGICQPALSKIVLLENQFFNQYPNPVESNLTIVSNLKLSSGFSVDLFDNKGDKINPQEYAISQKGNSILEINISDFIPGIYFWMIRDELSSFTGYFIKN